MDDPNDEDLDQPDPHRNTENIPPSEVTDASNNQAPSGHQAGTRSEEEESLVTTIDNHSQDLEMNVSQPRQEFETEELQHGRPPSNYESDVQQTRLDEHSVQIPQSHPSLLNTTICESNQDSNDQPSRSSGSINTQAVTEELIPILRPPPLQIVETGKHNDLTRNHQPAEISPSREPPVPPYRSQINKETRRSFSESVASSSSHVGMLLSEAVIKDAEFIEHHYVNLDESIYFTRANKEQPATLRPRKPLPKLPREGDS